ncbi:MAG: chorismate-binding protein, partial [Fimbriimonadaceae bacterium]
KRIRLREYLEDGPRAVAAGPVVHLRTDFVVDAMATDRPDLMETMVDLLHPTSAVCGAPLLTARDFIRQYEAHDRALYAGYWGPVGIEGVSDLYVNLRCMRWGPKTLDLFVGAGVTSSSQADQEWQETETKAQTLLRVLQ